MDNWLARWMRFNVHFGRFLQDALGISLIALSVMALLSGWGLSSGAILTPLSAFLTTWLGWGSYLLVFGAVVGGIALIRRDNWRIAWLHVLMLEIASLLGLGLLSMLGGNSLVRADAGMDGGRLGWGIAYFLTHFLGRVGGAAALSLAWLISALTGFGVWGLLERWSWSLMGEEVKNAREEAKPFKSEPDHVQTPAKTGDKQQGTRLPREIHPNLRGLQSSREASFQSRARAEGLPPLNLLLGESNPQADERTINQTAGMITKTLSEFGIPATVIGYRVGPAVTQFAIQPGFITRPGSGDDDDAQQMKVRVVQIANLQKDLALALSAERLRIEAPVPGKPYVGIEVPNAHASVVRLKPILESEAFHRSRGPLTIALGRDVSGQPVIADLAKMPHLLIAGSTGSGKSVCITSLAVCLTLNNAPEDLRLIMIDSKMVELLRFNGLPHLLGKVETNIDRILGVLRWIVSEMEHRYRLLESGRARDLDAYNRKQARRENGVILPRIVILVDELADLMMSAPDQTEHNLVRLAQMARATGIHLVVATQRPSTDVVTGVIKANFPARLAFAVASGVDSRVILDTNGAETLLGRGDMLFLNPEIGNPIRAQGVMVTDMEIERIVDHWRKKSDSQPETAPPWEKLLSVPDENEDGSLLEQAISLVRSSGRASASLLQRRLRIGYPRAARLLDQLEEVGIVGPPQGGGKERELLPTETGAEVEE